jgi:hypothetical protein
MFLPIIRYEVYKSVLFSFIDGFGNNLGVFRLRKQAAGAPGQGQRVGAAQTK